MVLPAAVRLVVVRAVTRTVLFPEDVYLWPVVALDVVALDPSPNVQA